VDYLWFFWLNTRSLLFALIVAAAWAGYQFAVSPWPAMVTLRHIAAVPNCAAARAVGLAPARIGEPGYYEAHDADGDGWSCEPNRR
jgi:hypothetical protein